MLTHAHASEFHMLSDGGILVLTWIVNSSYAVFAWRLIFHEVILLLFSSWKTLVVLVVNFLGYFTIFSPGWLSFWDMQQVTVPLPLMFNLSNPVSLALSSVNPSSTSSALFRLLRLLHLPLCSLLRISLTHFPIPSGNNYCWVSVLFPLTAN